MAPEDCQRNVLLTNMLKQPVGTQVCAVKGLLLLGGKCIATGLALEGVSKRDVNGKAVGLVCHEVAVGALVCFALVGYDIFTGTQADATCLALPFASRQRRLEGLNRPGRWVIVTDPGTSSFTGCHIVQRRCHRHWRSSLWYPRMQLDPVLSKGSRSEETDPTVGAAVRKVHFLVPLQACQQVRSIGAVGTAVQSHGARWLPSTTAYIPVAACHNSAVTAVVCC